MTVSHVTLHDGLMIMNFILDFFTDCKKIPSLIVYNFMIRYVHARLMLSKITGKCRLS